MKQKKRMRQALNRLASMEAFDTASSSMTVQRELSMRIVFARETLHECGYPAPGDEGWHFQDGTAYPIAVEVPISESEEDK